ncbi:glutamate racemase [Shewanella canadensis]|uniref:Glutamate racemase n=1 Tax=Shewanella canadensis TaxID=271096 RepID=A0A431WPM0_9GAMM|nr:glutamate racemase [Shewanella canadensis]RTR37403.1 glutamate racemase [Shewanella canadensis]
MSGPILVFDSGIGGLSILDEIRQVLPDKQYYYLFDNARLPYGELEEQVLITGCKALISSIVKRIDASLVVIACNTASTLVLPALREVLNIPVVGVVPAIKPAAALSRNKHIGVLATPGTIRRPYTHELIEQFGGDCKVELYGSSELVILSERKAAGIDILQADIAKILNPIKCSGLDTLVLGCTHFPMLKVEIQDYLGGNVLLLDSAKAVAARVTSLCFQLDETNRNRNKSKDEVSGSESKEMIALYTSEEISDGLKNTLAKIGFSNIEKVQTG